MGVDGIDLLNDMEEVVVAADVVDGLGGDDRVLDGMRSLVNISTRERMEPSSKIDGVALIEELGSEAKLIKLFLNAGVYPYKSVDFDGETFYAGEVGDYHSGCLVHRYELYSSWARGGYATTYSVPQKRILARYFLEGFNASRDKVLVRELLGSSKGCALRVINVSKKGVSDEYLLSSNFCVENGLGDYCVQDDPGVILDQVSGENRRWGNGLDGLFAKVVGQNVSLKEFLDLRAEYFRNRLLYRDFCKEYRETAIYSADSVRGFGFYKEYPDNSDYFGEEPDVDLFSVESLQNAISELGRRIAVYPVIFRLMDKRNWKKLKIRFPEGRIDGIRGPDGWC